MSRTNNHIFHIFRTLTVGSVLSVMAVYPAGVSFGQDFDNNPPGWRGGRGTNWENPPGPVGGPGASPDRVGRRVIRDLDNNPPGPRGGRGTNWENPPGPAGGPGASPNRRRR